MAVNFSTKQIQIDKAKATVVGSVAAAAFIVIFSLFASKALLSQRGYQSRVTKEQEKAVKQLRDNINATKQLQASYQQFVTQPNNVLGGNPAGSGDKDGDNAKIILDALPSKYDFPALAASLEKILTDRNFKIGSISGVDDEIAQSAAQNNSAQAPVEMPFKFSVDGNYDSIQGLIDTLQRSIRPINIQTVSFSSSTTDLHLDVSAVTYYLPEKQLNFPTKEVK